MGGGSGVGAIVVVISDGSGAVLVSERESVLASERESVLASEQELVLASE